MSGCVKKLYKSYKRCMDPLNISFILRVKVNVIKPFIILREINCIIIMMYAL